MKAVKIKMAMNDGDCGVGDVDGEGDDNGGDVMMEMLVRAMMVMAVEIKMAMIVTGRAVYGGDGEGDDVMVMALVVEIAEMGDDADSDGYDGNGDSGCDGEGDGVSDDGDGDGADDGANGKTR